LARPSGASVSSTRRVAAGQQVHHDFSRIPSHYVPLPVGVEEKSRQEVTVHEDKPDAGAPSAPPSSPAPSAPPSGSPSTPPAKSVGVDSFSVKWSKNNLVSYTAAKLLLLFDATFKDDATHDPAQADFRQNAFHKFECTAGPHLGAKSDTSPLHDDHYSRADSDMGGNSPTGKKFTSNDSPGPVEDQLDPDDVIDFSFTAEQMIIDKRDGSIVQKKGPHTATIKGKHPRKFDGVPVNL
jgi:hypothetical protein